MFDPIDSRYPYSVICSTTASPRPSSWSQHYSLAGAIRYARAISGIGKRGVPNLLSCRATKCIGRASALAILLFTRIAGKIIFRQSHKPRSPDMTRDYRTAGHA